MHAILAHRYPSTGKSAPPSIYVVRIVREVLEKIDKEASTMRRLATATVCAMLALAVGQAVPAAADPGAGTKVTVDRSHPFGALPRDFVGLSYEMRELSALCTTGDCTGNFDARRGNLVALFHNLGRSNVRIAGNQLDRDTMSAPAGQPPPHPLPDCGQHVVRPTAT